MSLSSNVGNPMFSKISKENLLFTSKIVDMPKIVQKFKNIFSMLTPNPLKSQKTVSSDNPGHKYCGTIVDTSKILHFERAGKYLDFG